MREGCEAVGRALKYVVGLARIAFKGVFQENICFVICESTIVH